jgi:hypothetical protein
MPEEKAELLHKVFISWSGDRSKYIALALRKLLTLVLHASKPFMSESDIDRGSRSLLELARALEVTKVGIVCLTPENLEASWLLFEAGALSKTLDRETRVFTYLLGGLAPGEVRPPLGQFQATVADKERTASMFQDINKALGSEVPENILSELFERVIWPDLEKALSSMPKPENEIPAKRSQEDMIAEILENSRAIPQMRETIHDIQDITVKAAERAYQEAVAAVRKQTFLDRVLSPDYSAAVAGLGGISNLKALSGAPEPKDKAKE